MSHLAAVVRSLRQDAALTQDELAERSGLSTRTVSDIERGVRQRLYRDTAQRLATALGLSEERIAEFVDHARGASDSQMPDLDVGFRRRFVSWHLDRVRALADDVGSEDRWFALLDADRSNLDVALRWADEAGDAEALLQLAAALFRYWQARGELEHGRAWFHRGLDAAAGVKPSTRTNALWGLAWLSYQQGDDDAVAICAEELDTLAADSDDLLGRRNAATVRGLVSLARNECAEANRAFSQALEFARDLGQPWLEATSVLNLGIAKIALRDTDPARTLIGEALRLYADLGDERFRARCLGYLGLAALVDSDADRGEALFAQSLSVFDRLGEPKGIAEGLSGLATAAAIRGIAERAATLGGAAERVRESFSGRALPVELAFATTKLAEVQADSSPKAWDAAWIRGRALRLEKAIPLALEVKISVAPEGSGA